MNKKAFALAGIPILAWLIIAVAVLIFAVFGLSAIEGLLRNINPLVFAGLIALIVWIIASNKSRKKK
jgi:hypothetical protein